MRVLIYGSCVSRDAFEVDGGEEFTVAGYFARSSIASAFATTPFVGPDTDLLPSKFQARIVRADLEKSLVSTIEEADFDVLLIDLVDERFDLICDSSGALCTASAELGSIFQMDAGAKRIGSGSEEFLQRWEAGWRSLVTALDSRGSRDRLRVNKVFWSTSRTDGGVFEGAYSEESIRRANEVLAQLYEIMAADLAPEQFYRYSDEEMVADASHKWGPAPFHYTNAFYDKTLRHLRHETVPALGLGSSIRVAPETVHDAPAASAAVRTRSLPADQERHAYLTDLRWSESDGPLRLSFRLRGLRDVNYVAVGVSVAGIFYRMLLVSPEQDVEHRLVLEHTVLESSEAVRLAPGSGWQGHVMAYVSGSGGDDAGQLTVGVLEELSGAVAVDGWSSRYRLPISRVDIADFVPARGLSVLYEVCLDSDEIAVISRVRGTEEAVFGFHGATDRSTIEYPFFDRVATMQRGASSFMLFCDRTVRDTGLSLGWYVGVGHKDLMEDVRRACRAFQQASGAERLLFVGGSGGGFAALQASWMFEGSLALVMNPQTDVSRYTKASWQSLLDNVFVETTDAEVTERHAARISAVERYSSDLTRNRVDFVINIHDEHHVVEHATPFLALYGVAPDDGPSELNGLRLIPIDSGPGHVPVPVEEFERLLDSAIRRMREV